MELHIDIHPGNGPYILLVHGILSSRAQYEPNLNALSKVARPVVLELWGHGRSPVPDDPRLFHPDAYVEAFEKVREQLGADRWMICGQSLGASLTLRYALDHPDRVSAQIITNSMAAFADAEWLENTRRNIKSRSNAIREGGLAVLEQMPFHPRNATRLAPEIQKALIKGAEEVDPLGVAQTIQSTVPETSVRERIPDNQVPTLLVCGTWEKRFLPLRDYAEKSMPNIEVVNLDAGHAVNLEASDAFNASAVSFIQRQTSTA